MPSSLRSSSQGLRAGSAMPRRTTAYGELDQLRQRVANEDVRKRELESQRENVQAELTGLDQAVTDALIRDDEKAARQHRERRAELEQVADDLGERLYAAEQRVLNLQREVDRFSRERARDLLEERLRVGRELAISLTRAAHEVVRLHRAYGAERSEIDRLVGLHEGASVRFDGPPSSHVWQRELDLLERAVRANQEVSAPEPTWRGLEHRRRENAIARVLRDRRQKTKPSI